MSETVWEGQVARGCVEALRHAASCVTGKLAVVLSLFISCLESDRFGFSTHTSTHVHTHTARERKTSSASKLIPKLLLCFRPYYSEYLSTER